MKDELTSAVNFITDLVRSRTKKPIPADKVEKFRESLQQLLQERCDKAGWDVYHPKLGMFDRRVIVTDNNIDPPLLKAARESDIPLPCLRSAFNNGCFSLWIDPGKVKCNEGGTRRIIYIGGIQKPTLCQEILSCLSYMY